VSVEFPRALSSALRSLISFLQNKKSAPCLSFIYNITCSRKQGSTNICADGINLSNLCTYVTNYTASHEDDYEVTVVNKPEITNTEKEIADLPYEEGFIRCKIFLDF
jgi:hypothetical protein